jgi:hypothetical protein
MEPALLLVGVQVARPYVAVPVAEPVVLAAVVLAEQVCEEALVAQV